jgi:hypothetical protein
MNRREWGPERKYHRYYWTTTGCSAFQIGQNLEVVGAERSGFANDNVFFKAFEQTPVQ